MNEKDLYNSLSGDNLPVYFLCGQERYPIDKAIQIVKDSLNPNFRELNFTLIDSENETDIDNMVSCCESIPFMDTKRVIVVKNSDLFQTTNKSQSKDQMQKIINYLDSPCNTTVVIFAPMQVDKRSELYKFMKKKYDIYQSDKLDKVKFSSWVSDKFKSKNVIIDSHSKEYFIQKSGYLFKDSEITLLDVESEIDKICLNSNNNNNIVSVIDIEKVSSTVNDNDVFKFIDYVFAGDFRNSHSMLYNILDVQKNAILLLSLLGRQLSLLIKIYILTKEKCSNDTISKMLMLHPFVVKKCNLQLKKYSYKELLDLYNLCSDMDYRIKKGQIRENIGIEVIVSRICRNKK
ncbi:DNA polymerase III, delta subunit [Peptoanaerobacter stomatis]|uniref:DNA polymerase III subunit delta n=1 Tax=Peptoanaerobacter stomatis TaxID=796937 RepID=J4WA79_9FIRM|nr:DNA polymerase III subunit delta [Peptoanaerobacter stomatis]EJU22556.1 DNA polymerase III, delta subunit [Peptoanaerobacter stomatis]NWO25448.1 DNA polymerase III subunit delta [Peptostreptococcaceae bacterium oral taxon 081]